MDFIKKYKILLTILVLFSLSLLLRSHNLPEIYIFGFDEEYQATYAWSLVKDPHPIWIGVSASYLDYYMGPYFTYFTAILLAISKGDVILTAYFAALVGVITTLVIFYIGRYFFNFTTGLVAASLHATLPLFVYYDQKYWNPMFVSLIALGIFVVLNLIKKSKWWWLAYAALAGIVFQTDLTPAPFLLIGSVYFIKDKYWKDLKLIIFSFLVFMLFYWPLIVFDYNHNWSNLTAPLRFEEQAEKHEAVFNPFGKFQTFFDSLGRVWYLQSGKSNADELNISCTSLSVKQEFKFIDQYSERTNSHFVLSFASLGLITYLFWVCFSSKKREFRILAIMLSVKLSFFLIYQGGSFEYYILDFLTLLLFIPGILISRMKPVFRFFPVLVIFLVTVFGINTIFKVSKNFSFSTKKQLIGDIMQIVGNNKFSIEGEGICHNYEGWRYLFKTYARAPDKSYTDKDLAWLYPDEVGSLEVDYNVILSEGRLPLQRDLSDYIKINKGGYAAYIKRIKGGTL